MLAHPELKNIWFVHLVFSFCFITKSLTIKFLGLEKCSLRNHFIHPIKTEQLITMEKH